MTSAEIQAINIADMSDRQWLKEIAFQLAVINERAMPPVAAIDPSPVIEEPPTPAKRGPGRPRKA